MGALTPALSQGEKELMASAPFPQSAGQVRETSGTLSPWERAGVRAHMRASAFSAYDFA
jgi:hypothetical protein